MAKEVNLITCLNNTAQIDSVISHTAQVSSSIVNGAQITNEMQGVNLIAVTYTAGESDNINLDINNTDRIITANIKEIQYASKADFPETGSENLIYVDRAEKTAYFWQKDSGEYISLGKDVSGDLDALDAKIDGVATDLATETQARETADITLQTNLDSEIATRTSEDIRLQDQITSNDNDITALQNELSTANTNISNNTADIETLQGDVATNKTAIDTNATDIANETTARETADANLQNQISTLSSNAIKDVIVNNVSAVDDDKNANIAIALRQDQADSLIYYLIVNDANAGTINIPKDQFLKSATYDGSTHILTFVFETTSGETSTPVDLSDLIDTYTAGNGLSLDNNKFSVKIDASGSSRLSVGENGLKLTDPTVDSELSTTSENAVQNKAVTAKINEIETSVTTNANNITTNTNNIATNTSDINTLKTSKQDTLTDTQLSAVNSGITSDLVAQITTNKTSTETNATNIASLQSEVANKADATALDNYVTLDGQETISGLKTFGTETTFNGVTEHNANVNINNGVLKVADSTNDIVTLYQPDKIVIEENGETTTHTLTLPKKDGTLLTDADILIDLKYSTLGNADSGTDKIDAWQLTDDTASINVISTTTTDGETNTSGLSVQKDYTGLEYSGSSGMGSIALASNAAVIASADSDNSTALQITPTSATLNGTQIATTNDLLSTKLKNSKFTSGETAITIGSTTITADNNDLWQGNDLVYDATTDSLTPKALGIYQPISVSATTDSGTGTISGDLFVGLINQGVQPMIVMSSSLVNTETATDGTITTSGYRTSMNMASTGFSLETFDESDNNKLGDITYAGGVLFVDASTTITENIVGTNGARIANGLTVSGGASFGGDSTFSAPVHITSGNKSRNGTLVVGGDYRSSGFTENLMKIGEIAFPLYETSDTSGNNCSAIVFQGGETYNYMYLGGSSNTSNTAPDQISFRLATTHNTTSTSSMTTPLTITSSSVSITQPLTLTSSLTIGGNLTVNGTTTTVDSTTLQVEDKLIEVAHGNTAQLTTPAGLVAPNYDGTNSGALVFDYQGIAYVGDVTLDSSGNIDTTNSDLQPLATRTGLVGGNLVQWDATNLTLTDSEVATSSIYNTRKSGATGYYRFVGVTNASDASTDGYGNGIAIGINTNNFDYTGEGDNNTGIYIESLTESYITSITADCLKESDTLILSGGSSAV